MVKKAIGLEKVNPPKEWPLPPPKQQDDFWLNSGDSVEQPVNFARDIQGHEVMLVFTPSVLVEHFELQRQLLAKVYPSLPVLKMPKEKLQLLMQDFADFVNTAISAGIGEQSEDS